MGENPSFESAKRFLRVGTATAAGIGAVNGSDQIWAIVLTPVLAALGKFLRTKWPKQLGWLPF